MPPRSCGHFLARRWHRDEDDVDRDHKRGRPRGFVYRMISWLDSRSKNKTHLVEESRRNGWFHGESSHGSKKALQEFSPPPPRASFSVEEEKAQRQLWKSKDFGSIESQISPEGPQARDTMSGSDAIVIVHFDLDDSRTYWNRYSGGFYGRSYYRSSVLIRTVASVANLEFVVSCNLPEPNPIRDKRRSSW
jgi:hypothetical protein